MRGAVAAVLLLAALGGSAAACTPSSDVTVVGTGGTPRAAGTPVLTAAEVVWLDGVERLSPRMSAVFSESPHAMTALTLRGLAADLGTCTRELDRLGTPSPRLLEVHDLVRQACREYDKGATCFAGAAGARSASGVQHYLDCGFAAATRGGRPLAAALLKGQELQAAP